MVNPARLLCGFFMLMAAAIPLSGEDAYRFNVTLMNARVTVESSGLAAVQYEITFYTEPGSHWLDVVDIGMPNAFFRLNTARAEMNGRVLTDIRNSAYVKPGVEVHLGRETILGGNQATLRFSIQVANLVFGDDRDPNGASLDFKTTWFGSEYVSGSARAVELRLDLPPGSQPDGVRYHSFGRRDYPPTGARFEADRVSYLWRWENVPVTQGFMGGASFPRRLVAGVYSPPRPNLGQAIGELIFAFFLFLLKLAPIWIPLLLLVWALVAGRRKARHYLPPAIGIESGGIKQGLTPPEAAVLQELPLRKVLLLIIYGMVRKGALEIQPAANHQFRFHKPLPLPDGIELREYEKEMLAAISGEEKLIPEGVRSVLVRLIRSMKDKLRGFSLRETLAHYRSIMEKAWLQVQYAPADKLPAALAEYLEWLLMYDDCEKKLGGLDLDGLYLPGRIPYWFDRLPDLSRLGNPTRIDLPGGTVTSSATRFVTAMESFSNTLINDPSSFTASVSRAVNPPPVRTTPVSGWSSVHSSSSHSSSSSSGSHSSCACACACACAGCACACAGGGR